MLTQLSPWPDLAPGRVADAIADWLVAVGVRQVFGVSGGGVAHLWGALCRHPGLTVVHALHESGAAFAATEASLASDAPVAVFLTTGPGVTNAITGLVAARQEGARVLALSGATPAARRHRGATQETHGTLPFAGLYAPGELFDDAALVESAEMLPATLQRLREGLARPGGFVGHLGLPGDVQAAPLARPLAHAPVHRLGATIDADALDALAARLSDARVTIIVGHEARRDPASVLALAGRLDATVFSTPRAKGVVPEEHPRCAGVVGFGGRDAALAALASDPPEVLLCLGSRLGEGSSQWSELLRPRRELIQVHPRASALGGTWAEAALVAVQAPVDEVVRGLLARVPIRRPLPRAHAAVRREPHRLAAGAIRPSALFEAIQRVVVDASDALVLAESGNAFAWAIHELVMPSPRLRVSVGWGSMGHMASGAIGAALGSGRPVVAVVGDGSMLMNNELPTAVRHGLPVVWVVLDDSAYTMCRQGMELYGIPGVDTGITPVDFAAWGRAVGAWSERVTEETALATALERALAVRGPALLDVVIDPMQPAPIGRRVQALTWNQPETP